MDGTTHSAPVARAVAAWVSPVARSGYAAKGVVYALVGGLALKAALASGAAGGATEALASLTDARGGRALLTLVAVGLFAHVAWRLVQALLDPEHPEAGARRVGMRAFYLFSAAVYGSLAVTAWQLGHGDRAAGGEGHEVWIARLLSKPFGAWLVMAMGLVVIGYGLHQLAKAAQGDVNRHLRPPDAATRRGLTLVGRIGTAARGLVLLPIGWFVFRAGRRYRAAEVADTGEVLRMLENDLLLAAVGCGLLAYGLHQFGKALFRGIRAPG